MNQHQSKRLRSILRASLPPGADTAFNSRYRRMKTLYKALPWNQRARFFVEMDRVAASFRAKHLDSATANSQP